MVALETEAQIQITEFIETEGFRTEHAKYIKLLKYPCKKTSPRSSATATSTRTHPAITTLAAEHAKYIKLLKYY